MTQYLTEAKPQCYRAVALFEDGRECLLYLGMSGPAIRAGYHRAFNEVLSEEERSQVIGIDLQQWVGAPDAGRWTHRAKLMMPNRKLVKVAA
jgi:hypothetical protein